MKYKLDFFFVFVLAVQGIISLLYKEDTLAGGISIIMALVIITKIEIKQHIDKKDEK